MRDGNPSAAADKYRTALSYDRENDIYRLRLAQALLASDRLNEARAHLLSLWDEEPADGEVNLDLARLYAKRNEPTQAVRYYRNAINGAWTDASQQRRIATRFDLIQYLLQRHDTGQASAELLALQADQPPDLSDRLRLAGLLLEVGEAARAFDVYNKVLKDNPDNLEAGLGLGTASFKSGDYQQAERAFSTVVEQDPTSTEAHKNLT
jgi:Tfp pilus assembly protein PilF